MATLSLIFYFLKTYPMVVFFASLGGILLFNLLVSSKVTKTRLVLFPLLWLAAFVNIFTGTWLNNKFLYTFGTRAEAVVTGVEKIYQFPNLNRFPVYISTLEFPDASGKMLQARFSSRRDTIFFPPSNPSKSWYNTYNLPQKGEPFALKYISGAPRNFVILADDLHIPYSLKIVCTNLENKVWWSELDYDRDQDNREFLETYRKHIQEFLAINCPGLETKQNEYRGKLELLP
jgi:hypothetical protein